MLERDTGVGIGRATLNGWVMRVGELLQPVTDAMRKDLLKAAYLQADETTVPVQMHDRRGSNHQAHNRARMNLLRTVLLFEGLLAHAVAQPMFSLYSMSEAILT